MEPSVKIMIQFVLPLAKRWWALVLPVVVCTAAGYTYARATDPTYTAHAYVIVVATDQGDVSAAVNFAQAYARIASQGDVLTEAVKQAALIQAAAATAQAAVAPAPAQPATQPAVSPAASAPAAAATGQTPAANAGQTRTGVRQPAVTIAELSTATKASSSPDAPVVEVAATAASPDRAATLANALAAGLVAVSTRQSPGTRMSLSVLSAATPPTEPTSPPRTATAAAVGAATGLLLAGLALLAGGGRTSRARREGGYAGPLVATPPVATPPDVAAPVRVPASPVPTSRLELNEPETMVLPIASSWPHRDHHDRW
jgi:capsular polysaccharide biosynthesis protein